VSGCFMLLLGGWELLTSLEFAASKSGICAVVIIHRLSISTYIGIMLWLKTVFKIVPELNFSSFTRVMSVLGFNRFKDEFILYETHCVPITETKWLILFKEIDSVHCETHTTYTNTVWADCRVLVC
jgi:hypothetical protein